jgi:spermidine synthase
VLPAEAQLPADAEAQLARKGQLSFPSRWSGKVHVRQRGKTRYLYLGRRMDIVHTRLHMDRPAELISPYQRCLLVAFALVDRPQRTVRRMAMVGLGGGALTRFFQIKLPDIAFHSVEIDPVVVAVARRFFGVRDTTGYRSYAMDGRAFLAQAKRPYDVIIIDAFDAEANMPRQLASVTFFKLLKQRLRPHGVLITNFLVHDRRIYASVYQTLKSVFPAVMRLPLSRFKSNNVLLIAPADPARLPDRATLSQRVTALGKTFAVDFPLAQCLDTRDQDRLPVDGVSVIREAKQAP